MVTITTDGDKSKASPSTSNGLNVTGNQKGVQFTASSSQGLPGGDMQLSRAAATTDIHAKPAPAPVPAPPLALTAPPSTIMGAYGTTDSLPNVVEGPPLDENGHKYVGLVNQAMTCYLNSLIQSLYMTPEFRNALYRWEYKSGKGSGESSIPCQLQKLFLLLQTTDRNALETKELTASFGWHSNEAYDQHDVQELCRLMFDALELKWKGTQHDKLIQSLYRGTMQDFVKCLTCGKENVRPDYFLDLPLAVKPFGAVHAFKSVEEALQAFVAPERLDGSNQYHCDSCNSKQDAHKGLRVTQFPKLLTIQLKRFDFDYNTMHRIKLNDRVTFPDILNLNPFVHAEQEKQSEEADTSTDPHVVRVGEPLDQATVSEYLREGPFVYQLFSVMVHQGSAAGGHYFAYVKNMDLDKWYCFNDSRVEVASPSEIERSFGGSMGGWSSSNTNAYMLMYRKMEDSNHAFMRTSELPTHIIRMQDLWRNQEEENEKKRKYQQSLVTVVVRLNMACPSEELLSEMFRMELPRTQPFSDVYNAAFKFFEERARGHGVTFGRNQARLIRVVQSKMTDCYVSRNDMAKPLESCLMNTQYLSELSFLLDVRTTSCAFLVGGDHQGRTIAIHRVDIGTRAVRPAYLLNVPARQKAVIQVKQLIGSVFGHDQREAVTARLVLEQREKFSNDLCLLDAAMQPFDEMARICYAAIPVVYYDGETKSASSAETAEDRKKELNESIMFAILDRKKFAMNLKILLPTEEDISRSASSFNAFSGPSWSETVNKEVTQVNVSSRNGEAMDEGEGGVSSGVSHKSGDEMSCDETPLSGGEEDSLCNNTPQPSPVVSDVDEGIGGDISPSDLDNGVMNLAPIAEANARAASSRLSERASSLVHTEVQSNGDCSQKIICLQTDSNNMCHLDVDSRITVSDLREWLSTRMNIDSSQFVLFRHHSDDLSDKGYESGSRDEEGVKTAYSAVNWLSVKLRPPLKADEKLIHIVQFDMTEPVKENWKALFDIPASPETHIGDILLACQRLYQDIYATKLDISRIRLREMQSMHRPVLRPDNRLDSRPMLWSKEIHMQILNDERVIGQPGEPVLVRRFRPSTVEVDDIHEVMVDVKNGDSMLALRQSISTYTGLPLDRVLVTEPPTTQWENSKWPYMKPRLEMLDGSVRFVTSPTTIQSGDLLDRIASRVIYYKDSEEVAKVISEDERKQITIKDNSTSAHSTVIRRKERPLRIQMSSISEP